jgi:hypothetical protein
VPKKARRRRWFSARFPAWSAAFSQRFFLLLLVLDAPGSVLAGQLWAATCHAATTRAATNHRRTCRGIVTSAKLDRFAHQRTGRVCRVVDYA